MDKAQATLSSWKAGAVPSSFLDSRTQLPAQSRNTASVW